MQNNKLGWKLAMHNLQKIDSHTSTTSLYLVVQLLQETEQNRSTTMCLPQLPCTKGSGPKPKLDLSMQNNQLGWELAMHELQKVDPHARKEQE